MIGLVGNIREAILQGILKQLHAATDASLNQFIHFCERGRQSRMKYLWTHEASHFWLKGCLYQKKKVEGKSLEAWFWIGTEMTWILFDSSVYSCALEAKRLNQYYDLGMALWHNNQFSTSMCNKIAEEKFLVLDVVKFDQPDFTKSQDCQTILRILGQDGKIYTAILSHSSYFPHMLYEKVSNE